MLVRPLEAATQADLTGRSVWTLASAADGFGDATISLARIWTGRMNAHAHAPGGEWMYVAEGQGVVWVEGLPVALTPGVSAYVPPGLLHNAENPNEADLVIVGITSPGVVPGSYVEQPPILEPTGRLTSTADLASSPIDEDAPGAQVATLRTPAAEDFPLSMRHIQIARGAGFSSRHVTARGWVVVGGSGRLTCDQLTTFVARYAVVLAPPGVTTSFAAGTDALELLELGLPS